MTRTRKGEGGGRITRISGEVTIEYNWTLGRMATKFYDGLKARKILAGRCPKCGKVVTPPREYCALCFEPTSLVEVGPGGTLETFSVVHYSFPHQPLKPPYTYGIIKFDRCDTGLTHLVKGDERNLRIGMRMEPVWRPKRTGHLRDILHFKPARAKGWTSR